MFNMEPRGYKLCAKVTVTKGLYQMAPRARATHQTLLNARDQRSTGISVNILDEHIDMSYIFQARQILLMNLKFFLTFYILGKSSSVP